MNDAFLRLEADYRIFGDTPAGSSGHPWTEEKKQLKKEQEVSLSTAPQVDERIIVDDEEYEVNQVKHTPLKEHDLLIEVDTVSRSGAFGSDQTSLESLKEDGWKVVGEE